MALLIDQIARINSFVMGGLSISLNLLLLYCINSKTTKHMAQYKIIMMLMTIFNILYSVVHMLSVPTMHIHESDLLILNTGYIKPVVLGRVLLVLYMFCFAQTTVLIANNFATRYFIICKSYFFLQYSSCVYSIGFFVSYLLIVSWTAIFCVSVWSNRDENEIEVVTYHNLFGEPYLETAYEDNFAFYFSVIYLFVILLFCAVISIWCSRKILLKLSQELNSNRTDRLQKQLFRCLIFQTCVPVVCTHLPIYLAFILPSFGVTWDVFLDLLPLPLAWYPVIDPIIVIINVRSFRMDMCKLFRMPKCPRLSVRGTVTQITNFTGNRPTPTKVS